ncbi:MAG: hypothetical protein KDJ14_03195 [Xanthomonadales bacterium]|nr:hypothetical protein [Xanthomonadales bacterium]
MYATEATAHGARTYATVGLDVDARTALRSMMDVLRGRTRSTWISGEPDRADLVFLGAHGSEHEARDLEHVRHVVRVARSGTGTAGFAMHMDYPFRVFQLLSVLQEIDQDVADRAPQDTPNEAPDDPDWMLFDALHRLSTRQGSGRWLSTGADDTEVLFVRDDLREYVATQGMLAAVEAGELPHRRLQPSPEPPIELPRRDASRLLWTVGLRAGRGELSPTLDAATHYRLSAWPDFGRLRAEPTHLRLCALLAAQAYRPSELIAQLGGGAQARQVHRFLNACAASGLLCIDRPVAGRGAVPSNEASVGFVGGLVARLRQRLGLQERSSARTAEVAHARR